MSPGTCRRRHPLGNRDAARPQSVQPRSGGLADSPFTQRGEHGEHPSRSWVAHCLDDRDKLGCGDRGHIRAEQTDGTKEHRAEDFRLHRIGDLDEIHEDRLHHDPRIAPLVGIVDTIVGWLGRHVEQRCGPVVSRAFGGRCALAHGRYCCTSTTPGHRAGAPRPGAAAAAPNVTSIIRTQLTRASLSVSRREMIHLECLDSRRIRNRWCSATSFAYAAIRGAILSICSMTRRMASGCLSGGYLCFTNSRLMDERSLARTSSRTVQSVKKATDTIQKSASKIESECTAISTAIRRLLDQALVALTGNTSSGSEGAAGSTDVSGVA